MTTTVNPSNLSNLGPNFKLPNVDVATLNSKSSVNSSDAEDVKRIASVEIKGSDVGKTSQPTKEVVAKAAEQIQGFVKEMGRSLSFSVDETTGYNVVRVINPETQEVIRQLPSEELLKIAQNMEAWNSVLVNQRA